METEWLDKLITEKRTAEDLSKLITEELGINYSVIVESEKITEEILSDIKTRKKNYFSNVPGVSYIDGRIIHSTFGYNLTVRYRYINFRDKNFFDDYNSKVPVLKNSFNVNTKTLTLTITAISGKVIEDTLYDTIQHELHHFFRGEEEEEDYTNGLYTALVDNYRNDNIPTIEILEKEYILSNIDDKELLRRIGRVIIKAQKDCSVPNDFHPNANKLTEYTKSTVDELFSLTRLPESSPFTGFP